MTLQQSVRARKLLGRIGALIFVVFFGSLLDSCVARFREPLFTVHLLPGGSDLVEGQVDHGLKDLSLLRVETSNGGKRSKRHAPLQNRAMDSPAGWPSGFRGLSENPPRGRNLS